MFDYIYNKHNRKSMRNIGDKKAMMSGAFMLLVVIMINLVILLMISNVMALGITPGRTTIEFEKNLQRKVQFSVINNEHKDMRVNLFSTVEDELNGSVMLFNDYLEFSSSEERKVLSYNIRLSDELSPGLHIGEVVAVEAPKNGDGKTFIGATVAVTSQIHVYVPYPGKYIDADLSIFNAEKNMTASFVIPMINRGKVGIGEAKAIIEIEDIYGKKVKTLETGHLSLYPGERAELFTKWEVDVEAGNYKANVVIFYDGETKELEKEFTVGTPLLVIDKIMVNNFRLGEIAKIQMLVENRWNQQLNDVMANLLVYNYENEVMADIKSANEDIPALTKRELIAYWDTVGVQEGEYNGKLMIKYGSRSSDKNLLLKVSEDSLEIFGVGYAVRPSGGNGVDIVMVLIVLIIILLVVNLSWFIFFKRMRRKK